MPYTPPSPSPTASFSNTRSSSRKSSISTPPSSTTFAELTATIPSFQTKSTAYLQKHRRGQSAKNITNTPEKFNMNGSSFQSPRSSSSLHQSPLPVNNASIIPTGAVISPPDSSQNSSDDELTAESDKRGRQLVNLAELEEAIRSIPQRKQPSPDRGSSLPETSATEVKSPQMLSAAIHNKISHSRSASDSYMRDFGTAVQAQEESDDEDEDGNFVAPPMVRKKSGELVKSSLKAPAYGRRHSSMPSTPTYPKAVHFDAHLEHVRHFLQAEKPLAVSAGSSPVESSLEMDTEYPFPVQEFRTPSFEWEIGLPNFPESVDRTNKMVQVEKVVLSHDNKNILGTVAVSNISFHKLVVGRFTMDYWQTTSEVAAEYNNDVRKKQRDDGYDRFTFKIKLEDLANLENKTLFFCVRYRVGEKEFWDNNSSMNYQVDFKKKAVPQNGKNTSTRFALPRSRPSGSAPRPRSMPVFDDSFDAFDVRNDSKYKLYGSVSENSSLPSTKSKVKLAPASDVDDHEAPARRANPSGNAFGNRYDFEASLAAAITTAAKVLGPERSGLKVKQASPKMTQQKQPVNPYFRLASAGGDLSKKSLPRSHSSPALHSPRTQEPKIPRLEIKTATPEPKIGPLATKTEEKPSIESSSYRELLDNYCFVSSFLSFPLLFNH